MKHSQIQSEWAYPVCEVSWIQQEYRCMPRPPAAFLSRLLVPVPTSGPPRLVASPTTPAEKAYSNMYSRPWSSVHGEPLTGIRRIRVTAIVQSRRVDCTIVVTQKGGSGLQDYVHTSLWASSLSRSAAASFLSLTSLPRSSFSAASRLSMSSMAFAWAPICSSLAFMPSSR